MKTALAAAAAATTLSAALLAAPASHADTIDWSQFNTQPTSGFCTAVGASSHPCTGTTKGSVGFTLTGPGNKYFVFSAFNPFQFPVGVEVGGENDPLAAGMVTIAFNTGIASFTDLGVEGGCNTSSACDYSVTVQAFDGATSIYDASAFSNSGDGVGTAPIFDITAPGGDVITSIEIEACSSLSKVNCFTGPTDELLPVLFGNDSSGPVVVATPEPAAWALMLAGFAGLGAALRTRRRRAAPA